MTDTKVAGGYVEISAKGMSAVQAAMAKLKGVTEGLSQAEKKAMAEGVARSNLQKAQLAETAKRWDTVKQSIQSVGRAASVAFAAASAAIYKFVEAASPKDFDDFKIALFEVSIQLGRVMLPFVRELTKMFHDLAMWLKSLTDEQRASVAMWVKVGLAMLAVLMIAPKLVALFSLIKSVGSAVGLISFTPMLAGLLAVLATLGLIALKFQEIADRKDKLSKESLNGDVAEEQYQKSAYRQRIQRMKDEGKTREEISQFLFQEQRAAIKLEEEAGNKAHGFFAGKDEEEAFKQARNTTDVLRRARTEFVQDLPQSPFAKPEGKGKGSDFTGQPRPQAPQFVGLSDFAKKIQESSAGTDMEARRLQAILDGNANTAATNAKLDKLTEVTQGNKPVPETRRG